MRTRFAPSPTGYLHVGSARTALYCWLYARQVKGTFILRIEDTDLERSTQEAVDAILDSMQWLGLNYDEGPFYQTKRFDRYAEVAHDLLAKGLAYKCYCTKERLEALREDLMVRKEKPRYDGHCRDLVEHPEGVPYVIRFKNPLTGVVSFDDAVRGEVSIANEELDDLIIARSDGTPTYNFTVVVDDADMQIDTVIRGEDHIANTPRQINILRALGAQIPRYAHIPMILGSDGKRLSKRHGAVSVMQYCEDGYLPHALLNYLVRLGWSHGDQEIFSTQEMIAAFDFAHISKSAAAFNPEKLNWLNQHYLKTMPLAEVVPFLEWQLVRLGIDYSEGPKLEKVIEAFRERVHTTLEMAEKSRCYYNDNVELDAQAVAKHLTAVARGPLELLVRRLEQVTDWVAPVLHQVFADVVAELGVGMGKLAQPVRVALTGNTVSPSIDVTLELVGKSRSLQRLRDALALIAD